MKEETKAIIGVGSVAVAIVAVYLFTRDKEKKEAKEEVAQAAALMPGLTPAEATAIAAAQVAAQQLLIAQQAGVVAQVQPQAAIVTQLQAQLQSLQAVAIAQPTPANIQQAEVAEAQTLAAQKEMERRYTEEITITSTAMIKAEETAKIATAAYESVKADVAYWLKEADNYAEKIKRLNVIVQQTTDPVLSASYLAQIQAWRLQWDRCNGEAEKKRNEATAVRVEAVYAITSTELVVERMLTLAGELRLLGILIALSNRATGIAQATRTMLAELERKLA